MTPTRSDERNAQADPNIYSDRLRLFVTGLGAYLALVVTSVSGLMLLAVVLVGERVAEVNGFAFYLIVPSVYLLAYTALTARMSGDSTGIKVQQFVKRLFDVIVSALGLLEFLPVFFLVAVAIRIDSPGSVIVRFGRIGQFGRPFEVYKFRTFRTKSPTFKLTRVGRVLRRFSLDELPGIYNVLVGEMSLVGPRPRVAQALYDIGDSREKILAVRPGMTGLCQVSAHSREQAFELDLHYAEHWSLLLDLKIILKTMFIVFSNRRKRPA